MRNKDFPSSTRIKDAGMAIRHLRGRILFYTAGSRNALEGMEVVCPQGSWRRPGTHEKKLYLRKIHFFVIEKYIEDVKQDEKDVPDLLELVLRPTCPVKEELRTNSCKSNGLQTRLKKNTFSILLRRPRPLPWPGPGPRPGPLRRRVENIN